MAHTPRCIPLVATIETIVLPSKDAQKTVPSGDSQSTGIVLQPGGSIIINSPVAEVTLEIPWMGDDSQVCTVKRGFTRVIVPWSYSPGGAILGTCTNVWYAWREDLRAYDASSA